MKRLVSFLIGTAVVLGVLVLFIVFATHSGPPDSPRDTNNTKSAPATAGGARYLGGPSLSVRV
jgi:hypothetical protein